MVTCTGHIGIHEGADGRTYVRCTDVHDVMAIKPNFLTSMGYHIFLSMVLRAHAPLARAELRYKDTRTFSPPLSDLTLEGKPKSRTACSNNPSTVSAQLLVPHMR